MVATSCCTLEGVSRTHLTVFEGSQSSDSRDVGCRSRIRGRFVLGFVYIVCACSIKPRV